MWWSTWLLLPRVLDRDGPIGVDAGRVLRGADRRVGRDLDPQLLEQLLLEHAVLREVTDEIMRAIQALSGQVYVDVYAAEHKRRLRRSRRARDREAEPARVPYPGG